MEDSNNRVVVQMAMKRRVRDGALLALQVDNTLSKVEVLIPAEIVPYLVHLALGVQSCFSKDRGFEDPLRSKDDHTDHNDASASVRNKDDSDTELKDGDNNDGEEGVEEKEATKEDETAESIDKPKVEENASPAIDPIGVNPTTPQTEEEETSSRTKRTIRKRKPRKPLPPLRYGYQCRW